MDRETIIGNLDIIWNLLNQGDNIESELSSLLFLCSRRLKNYWFGINYQVIRQKTQQIDEVEYFLSCIADL